jgi:hypothetical protein
LQAKAREAKDNLKIYIKTLSFFDAQLIFILQIPILCVLLQGY